MDVAVLPNPPSLYSTVSMLAAGRMQSENDATGTASITTMKLKASIGPLFAAMNELYTGAGAVLSRLNASQQGPVGAHIPVVCILTQQCRPCSGAGAPFAWGRMRQSTRRLWIPPSHIWVADQMM